MGLLGGGRMGDACLSAPRPLSLKVLFIGPCRLFWGTRPEAFFSLLFFVPVFVRYPSYSGDTEDGGSPGRGRGRGTGRDYSG